MSHSVVGHWIVPMQLSTPVQSTLHAVALAQSTVPPHVFDPVHSSLHGRPAGHVGAAPLATSITHTSATHEPPASVHAVGHVGPSIGASRRVSA
jgi:hypothetical protein